MSNRTEKALNSIVGLTVTRVINNYVEKTLTLYLDNDTSVIFFDCKLIFDLGIIGHKIGEVSSCAGLGMTLELNKYLIDSNDYQTCSISRNFSDFLNKNEIRIAYKHYEIKI